MTRNSLGLACLLLASACSRTRESHAESNAALAKTGPALSVAALPTLQPPHFLTGQFKAVAKRASGSAHYAISADGTYQLQLEHVEVDAKDPIHVYLVARDDAPTTASVQDTEDKYDVGSFNPDAFLQSFDLPSEPDPALRVVVLWNVRFGVNLAQAQLR